MRFFLTPFAALVCCGLLADNADIDPMLQIDLPGIELSVVATQPDVMTPTGIDVDQAGRIWVLSCHTHFRPDDYEGPVHDEVVVLQAGQPRKVFYNATDATMDLEIGDKSPAEGGWLYLAERDRIIRVRDTDGDGVGDQETTIAVLESDADYPHNGLSGLAWHPSGDLVFALGENYSNPWTLRSPDGSTVQGIGEGGIFRCDPDGGNLRRVALGFWNPFGVVVRSDGEMFVAENDPGARPPCRVLHVVEGGDYGYQRRYGPAPFHPFVCWNGELRGTLPMLHSSGEAPCGIAICGGGIIVPSWADNRIDFFPLTPAGASYKTHRVVLAEGSYEFRPTCIVAAQKDGKPVDGKLTYFLTDWTIGSYEIHNHGRVWKLEIDTEKAEWFRPTVPMAETEDHKFAARLRDGSHGKRFDELLELAEDDDPFIARAAIVAVARTVDESVMKTIDRRTPAQRANLAIAFSLREPKNEKIAARFLNDADPEVRFEALRWITNEDLTSFQQPVETKILKSSDVSYKLFEAGLACVNTLKGNPKAGITDLPTLLQRLKDDQSPAAIRAFALRLIPSGHKALKPKLLKGLLAVGDESLTFETVRSMAGNSSGDVKESLSAIAGDHSHSLPVRTEAIAALSSFGQDAVGDLFAFAIQETGDLQTEALRGLRFLKLTNEQQEQLANLRANDSLVSAAIRPESAKKGHPDPKAIDEWVSLLKQGQGNAEAGRRIFFHSRVGTCSQCHRHSGRGNVVGPDLSAPLDFEKSLTSLLQPNRDVDPQYFPWLIVTVDGQSFTGIMLRKGGSGKEFYRNNQGKEVSFHNDNIEIRRELNSSLMPDGLHNNLTLQEIRDVLAFLTNKR